MKPVLQVPQLSLRQLIKCPSAAELESLYKNLSQAGQPVILSLIPDYCNSYIPLCVQRVLPKPLTDLFQKEYMSLLYHMLLEKCDEVSKHTKLHQS